MRVHSKSARVHSKYIPKVRSKALLLCIRATKVVVRMPLRLRDIQARLPELRPPRGLLAAAFDVAHGPAGETHKKKRLFICRRLPWRGSWLCYWLRAPAGCAFFPPARFVLLLLRQLFRLLVSPLLLGVEEPSAVACGINLRSKATACQQRARPRGYSQCNQIVREATVIRPL